MNKKAHFIAALMFCFSFAAKASEPDYNSGNYMLPHCQHYTSSDHKYDVWDGTCGGIIETLIFLGKTLPDNSKICAPKEVPPIQAARIVIAHMQSHPQELHLPFIWIAIRALHLAWVCE